MEGFTERVPVLRLWNRLLVTLQGEISDDIAQRLFDEIMDTLHTQGARGLILDVTGVWTMDSHLCSVLSRLSQSAKLMGTDTILSGLGPEIAQTLQTMGIELEVETALTVEQALAKLGLDVSERPGANRFAARRISLKRTWQERMADAAIGRKS